VKSVKKKRRTKFEMLTVKLDEIRKQIRELQSREREILRERRPYLKWLYAHPSDIKVYEKLNRVANFVAKKENLGRVYVKPKKHPYPGRPAGHCWSDGTIKMLVRLKWRRNGSWEWAEKRDSDASTIDLLAHELGHLKHMNHRPEFKQYVADIRGAVWEAWENFRTLARQGLL
jgi:hypothetical protein